MNDRITEAELDPLFVERWSPRAFSAQQPTEAQVASLFEAARWAPSASNFQPALFLYARRAPDLARFQSLLVAGNAWAKKAPLLAYVFARRHFSNGKENATADFDTGAAWMSLSLRAHQLGLFTHGMAGFDHDGAYEVLGVNPEEYRVIAAIAVGFLGDPSSLTPELAAREVVKSQRKPLAEVAQEGVFRVTAAAAR